MQGLYIYEALCDVAPILHAFAKPGTKPLPYSEKALSSYKEVQLASEAEEKAE